jgi:hypothetical protein
MYMLQVQHKIEFEVDIYEPLAPSSAPLDMVVHDELCFSKNDRGHCIMKASNRTTNYL